MTPIRKSRPISPFVQFVVSFAIPLFVLSRFSAESQLGPARALLLALAFPVVLEIFSVYKRRKLSMLSLLAVGGILVTGAISLLGLSEGWLAIRRSVPYLAVAIAILVSIWIKRPLVNAVVPKVLDMERIEQAVGEQSAHAGLNRIMLRMGYLFAALFVAVAIASYVMTRVVIVSPTDTAAFNQEYARLRLLTLPAVSLPMLLAVTGIVLYVISAIEKLTGLKAESLLKKK